MNAFGLLFLVINGVLLLRLPRRWAPLPFLLGSLYMTNGQMVEIGPCHFTVMRLMVVVGVLRVILRGERIYGGMNRIDRFMLWWGVVVVASSPFHKQLLPALVYRCGFGLDWAGAYWLMRVFIHNIEDVLHLAKIVILLLLPLAAEMIKEKVTQSNTFEVLGGIYPLEVRDGKIRAQGPFAHSILAGTAGAASIPLALLFWRRNRKLAVAGLIAAASMVITSASSGPILTAAAAIGALALWRIRAHLRTIRWAALFGVLVLSLVMNGPVYSLPFRINLTGSSTGWHRQALIDAAIRHLDEWWLAGTDYTRHWMPTGILANDNHTDITNVYLMMGVVGGMPLMLLFVAVLIGAFVMIGRTLLRMKDSPLDAQFVLWTLGAILWAHAVTFLSVSYFDQTIFLYYMVPAAIASLGNDVVLEPEIAVANQDNGVPDSVGEVAQQPFWQNH